MNKKAQLHVLTSPPILYTIGGAVLGFIIASSIGQDTTLGLILGGIAGFLISTRFR